MSDGSILQDCLDTLKHGSLCYLRASHEADSDEWRETWQSIAVDKAQLKNAVFNFMHQGNMYRTRPAAPEDVALLQRACSALVARIGAGHGVDRERGGGAGSNGAPAAPRPGEGTRPQPADARRPARLR